MQTIKKILEPSFPQPVEPKIIIRLLLVVIVLLAYLAGYYHSLWQLETKKLDSFDQTQYNTEELKIK